MPAITTAAIAALLQNDDFRFRPVSVKTGVQVNLEVEAYENDYQKLQAIEFAFNKLKEAGYPVTENDVKLAAPPRGNNRHWTSWQCIFVSKPDARRQGEAQTRSAIPAPDTLLKMQEAGWTPAQLIELYGAKALGGGSQPQLEDRGQEQEGSGQQAEQEADQII